MAGGSVAWKIPIRHQLQQGQRRSYNSAKQRGRLQGEAQLEFKTLNSLGHFDTASTALMSATASNGCKARWK